VFVGQGLVVVGVDPNVTRARVRLGARRVVRAEAAAVGAPAAPARRRRTVHRTPGARVGEYHMTNAGFSDATTVAAHDSASTSITPPADSRLASKNPCVDRNSNTSNVQREGIRTVAGGSPWCPRWGSHAKGCEKKLRAARGGQ